MNVLKLTRTDWKTVVHICNFQQQKRSLIEKGIWTTLMRRQLRGHYWQGMGMLQIKISSINQRTNQICWVSVTVMQNDRRFVALDGMMARPAGKQRQLSETPVAPHTNDRPTYLLFGHDVNEDWFHNLHCTVYGATAGGFNESLSSHSLLKGTHLPKGAFKSLQVPT